VLAFTSDRLVEYVFFIDITPIEKNNVLIFL